MVLSTKLVAGAVLAVAILIAMPVSSSEAHGKHGKRVCTYWSHGKRHKARSCRRVRVIYRVIVKEVIREPGPVVQVPGPPQIIYLPAPTTPVLPPVEPDPCSSGNGSNYGC